MKPFCEIVVSNVLPSVRALITKELLDNYKLTQQEVAELLGLTQPAISQYQRQSRGFRVKTLEKSPKIMKSIGNLASDIASGKVTPKEIQNSFCDICGEVRKAKLICKLHEDIYPGIAPCSKCPSC